MSIQRIIEIPLEEVQTDKAKDTDISLNFCCCICAKPLRKAGDYKLVHITNRNTIVSTDQDIEGSLGFFPVGNECVKKLVITFTF